MRGKVISRAWRKTFSDFLTLRLTGTDALLKIQRLWGSLDNMKIKAITALMAIPPLMMELLVGNLSPAAFFNPLMFLILFMGYSIPVVLFRELSIRWKLDTRGIFILGIIYGIINEGLGAKTLLARTDLPTPSFNDFGFWGLNFPFTVYVLVIQSLVSLVIPIVMVHQFFPDIKGEYWLGKRASIILAALSATGITAIFFSPFPRHVNAAFFPLFLALMAVLACIARALPMTENKGKPGLKHLFLGMAFVIIYGIGLDFAAKLRIPLPLFFILWATITLLFSGSFSQPLFGLGVYMLFGLTGIISNVLLKGHGEGLVSGLLFEAFFMWIAWRLMREISPEKTPPVIDPTA
jgi:hypothetical protein